MPHPPRLLLWTDAPGPYVEAIGGAASPDASRRDAGREGPALGRAARGNRGHARLGRRPGLLPRMPKLRWVQALTAGVEGWLALPDLPEGVALTCARGTHRESMPRTSSARCST
jgi:hypothetical protein